MSYLALKYVHIVSMVLLFGTGFGSAFYKWMADRSGNIGHIAMVNRHVVQADWLFTTPTILLQPLTGIWLAHLLGLPLATPWLLATFCLYALAGACWLPVVWLQIRMHAIARSAFLNQVPLAAQYWYYARLWFWLGIPAFCAMLLIVMLMVFKPDLWG